VVVLSIYASFIFTPVRSFGILSVGVLLTVAGSILLFLFDKQTSPPPENHSEDIAALAPVLPEIDASEYEEQKSRLQEYQSQLYALNERGEAYQATILELRKQVQGQDKTIDQLSSDLKLAQETSQEQQEHSRLLLHEHQQTINEQRDMLEKKQQHISQLEGQVRDLHYEIKTLMEVEERQSIIRFPAERFRQKEYDFMPMPSEEEDLAPPPHVHCPDEASQQLKRCLDIAQKITGGQYMHNRPSRLKDLPVENTALEMRRLFDNLRSENQATILLYSPKDNKLLFVNNPIKSLLGWPPEKFVQQFQELQTDGGEAWKQAVSQLAFKNESQATLGLISKTGQHVTLNCQLGLIPTGSFRHFVLGVLYPGK
jgi:hypothetical protein